MNAETMFANGSPDDKIAILIDGENLHYGAKNMGIHLDYLALSRKITGDRNLRRCGFYTTLSNKSQSKVDFINFLKLNGLQVTVREVHEDDDGNTRTFGNLDVDLAVDAMAMVDNIDTFVICSGDGDFVPLVKKLVSYGKHVVVCALRTMTSTELISSCDLFIDLKEIKDDICLDSSSRDADNDPDNIMENEY
jgi:uncharacterized LabA/DUF88 family protein